jgi:hypothetical protein
MKIHIICFILSLTFAKQNILQDPSFEKTCSNGYNDYWDSYSNHLKYDQIFCMQHNQTECPLSQFSFITAHTGKWFVAFTGFGAQNSLQQIYQYLDLNDCKKLITVNFYITVISTGFDSSYLSVDYVGESLELYNILTLFPEDAPKYQNYTLFSSQFRLNSCLPGYLSFLHRGFANEDGNITHFLVDDVSLFIE